MNHFRSLSRFNLLLALFLFVAVMSGCAALSARSSKPPADPKGPIMGRGLRVTTVYPGSPAQRAGLRTFDLIFRYGEHDVVDEASYFAARESYAQGATVPLLILRDGRVSQVTAETGWLGIESQEYGVVAIKLAQAMEKVTKHDVRAERQNNADLPAVQLERNQLVAEAKSFIDQTEQEGTLTPTQILVARIELISDDASPEDLQRQSELVSKLVATQLRSYVEKACEDRFFEKGFYRAAIQCYKEQLKSDPDDVSVRLNAGFALNRLGMYAEAQESAAYVFDHKLELGPHGFAVAYSVLANAMLGRGQYREGIALAERAFAVEPNRFDICMVMMAAAESGNVRKVAEASRKFQEQLPQEFAPRQAQVAAVEALGLVRNNQREKALELAREWKGNEPVGVEVRSYWKNYPGGADVWANWIELTKN
ncbi:MAG TPA: hypothetical protein VLL54_06690 [Pyrinomonadaceae bacterium]|nr:hypothetical protein [Pyrinomonadaceae bacterium]